MGLFQGLWLRLLLLPLLLLTSLSVLQTCRSDVAPLKKSHGDDGVDCEVEVDAGSIMATTDDTFVCATLDWYPQDRCSYGSCSWDHASILNLGRLLTNGSGRTLYVQNLTHPLLEKSLQALSPLRLRLGGTVQDEIVYDIGLSDPAKQCLPLEKDAVNITGYRGGCLSMERWIALNKLFSKSGVQVVFGLNALYNRSRLVSGTWGPWDSSNARDFIKFTVEQGIAVEGWELGNELTANRVVTSLPAKQYGDDIKQLRFLVDSLYQEFGIPQPLVVAPDGTGNVAGTEYEWYTTFLNESGPAVVDAISRHIYNLGPGDSTILVERILDPSVLDDDKGNFRAVQQIIKTTAPWATAWVGEAGGAYNSGKHLVSNAFVMSFWYLDQLAMAATFNTKSYCRQTLIGGNYGLLNSTTFRPNPDLYSAILFKRFMGTRVLATTVETDLPKLRAYTHCQAGSTSGGLVMLLINLSNSSSVNVEVDLKSSTTTDAPISTQKSGKKSKHLIGHKSKGMVPQRQEYHLSAANGDLHSQTSLLNGVPLEVTPSGDLPNLDIAVVKDNSDPVSVAALSIVFVVLPNAQIPVCMAQLRKN